MKLKIFIPIIFLIILSINVFGNVGTQYLITGTTITGNYSRFELVNGNKTYWGC